MIGKLVSLIMFSCLLLNNLYGQCCEDYSIPKTISNHHELKVIKRKIKKGKNKEAYDLLTQISSLNFYSIMVIGEFYYSIDEYQLCEDTLKYALKKDILNNEKELLLSNLIHVYLLKKDTALALNYLDSLYFVNNKSIYYFNKFLNLFENDYDKYRTCSLNAVSNLQDNEYYLYLVNNALKHKKKEDASEYLAKFENIEWSRGALYPYTKANYIVNSSDSLSEEQRIEARAFMDMAWRLGSNVNLTTKMLRLEVKLNEKK